MIYIESRKIISLFFGFYIGLSNSNQPNRRLFDQIKSEAGK